MKFRAFSLLGATLLLTAQTATVPQLYITIALPGDKARHISVVIIDPPLTLTSDSQGRAHLGIALPCQLDANNNMSCKQTPQPVVLVKDETPVSVLNGYYWLAQTPITGTLDCSRNKTPQVAGTDYTIIGPKIVAPTWVPGDTIACTYSYRDQ